MQSIAGRFYLVACLRELKVLNEFNARKDLVVFNISLALLALV